MRDDLHRGLAMAPGRFYDHPWAAGSPLLAGQDLLEDGAAGPGWRRIVHGAWVYLLPPGTTADHGWKVHVSALPEDAAEVAGLCRAACRELGVPMKALRTRGLVLAGQQKYADPASSGKVVTCYPPPRRLRDLAELLATCLAGRPAPRIVGELQVPGAPVYLRHGANVPQWITGRDGRPVPAIDLGDGPRADLRGRRTGPRSEEPDYVTELRAAAAEASAGQRLDVVDIALVHRSNAGGVYRATWPDGRPVILKEGRHHAGLDLSGVDARTRLRHEAAALRRLAGSGAAPELLDLITVGDSDFLVTESVPGSTVHAALAARHPAINVGPDARTPAEYLRWADLVVSRARGALEQLHARGVVHRDVQPANLIDTGERVVVIDFESCAIDGTAVSVGVATPGFSDAHSLGVPEDDLASLDRVHLVLTNPLTSLLHRRPDLEEELRAVGLADLGVAPMPPSADLAPAPSWGRLTAGLDSAATPERDDRLFPGDAAQFAAPRAGLGLLHGAAGVLLALSRVGEPVDPAWTCWLVEHAVADGPFPAGLGDGVHGVAWALSELGEAAAVDQLVERWMLRSPGAPVPWWRHGAAGRALAMAAVADRLDGNRLRAVARAEAAAAAEAVRSGRPLPGYRPGLCSGWSGVGLALLRLSGLVDDATALAHAALRLDLAATRTVGHCLLARTGHGLLPYLGDGSAAIGLLAAALLAEPDLAGDARADAEAVAAGVRAACAQRVAVFSGLLSGRAGLLVTLDALTGGRDPMIAEHRRRLSWHTTEFPDGTYPLGDHNLRHSTDLGTGTAGMLVALTERPGPLALDLLGLRVVTR